MNRQSADQIAQQKLANIRAPRFTGIAGLSIIVVGFLISIVNASIDTASMFARNEGVRGSNPSTPLTLLTGWPIAGA